MRDDTHDITSAATASPQQVVDSDGDFDWNEPYPKVAESAPGDALYETLEDFVFDQSEGEDSDNDWDKGEDQEGSEDGDSESKQLGHTMQSSSTAQPGPSTQLESTKKATYARFTEEQKLVVYLLKEHHALSARSFTTVFNEVFRGEGVNRTVDSLEKWWSRNKDDWKNKFVNPSPDELAEHNKWDQKVKDALKALRID